MSGKQAVFAARLLLGTLIVSSTTAVCVGDDSAKKPFHVAGVYVEGCSCPAPCACEMMGVKGGCEGVGAMNISSGTYQGISLAGSRIAYATAAGDWVRVYVDAKDPKQAAAAKAFGKAVFSEFGKVEAVREVPIQFIGKGGNYTVSIDGGQTMQLTTTPVLGADKKTAIAHTNIGDPLNKTFLQGKSTNGVFKEGERSFDFKDTNSYFNDRMNASGNI